MIRIKSDFIAEDKIMGVTFNDETKEVIFNLTNGMLYIYGMEFKINAIPSDSTRSWRY